MFPFQHIFSDVGYALINSLWQGALLLGVYAGITSLFSISAAGRFRLAAGLSFTGFFWFLFSFFLPATPDLSKISSLTGQTFVPPVSVLDGAMYILACLYLLWLLFSFIHWVMQYRGLSRPEPIDLQKVPARWRLFVEQHAALLGITKRVELRITRLCSPATFGWLKPVILIPAACITQLSPAQMEALLLHELAHIRRYDYLVHIGIMLTEKVLYFNPFMRKLVKEARIECEHACDDFVLQFNFPPQTYAGALLVLAKTGIQQTTVLQATGNQSGILYNRICRILQMSGPSQAKQWKSKILWLLIPILALWIAIPRHNLTSFASPFSPVAGNFYWQPKTREIPETDWQRTLLDARISLLTSAIGKMEEQKAAALQKQHQARFMQDIAMREKEASRIRAIRQDDEPVVMQAEKTENASLILSAQWAQQQVPAATEDILTAQGWQHMQNLLDKLEANRNLTEAEWEQLAALITLHNEIRQAILEDAYAMEQSPVMPAALAPATPTEKEVLVIVYDETTGVLAASAVPYSQVPAMSGQTPDLADNEKEVILLRRKTAGKSKIISL